MNPRTSLITNIHREVIGSMGKLLVRFSRSTMYYLIGSSNKNEEIKKKNREFSSIKNSALPSFFTNFLQAFWWYPYYVSNMR